MSYEKSMEQGTLRGGWCYDLAKWLSHYLYSFSFSFYLVSKDQMHGTVGWKGTHGTL